MSIDSKSCYAWRAALRQADAAFQNRSIYDTSHLGHTFVSVRSVRGGWAASHPDAILTYRLEESRRKAVRTRARRAHRRARQK